MNQAGSLAHFSCREKKPRRFSSSSMVFFDDAARTSRGLVLACVDCARFDPGDPLARVLALVSAAPYAMVMCAAAVRGRDGRFAFYFFLRDSIARDRPRPSRPQPLSTPKPPPNPPYLKNKRWPTPRATAPWPSSSSPGAPTRPSRSSSSARSGSRDRRRGVSIWARAASLACPRRTRR